jgi:TolB-like protein/Flp pilus assembly protein TadD
MPEPSLLQRLKERKLVQWALAYLAGAFVLFQLLDALEGALGLTATVQRAVLVIVGIGFFITLILAWYHGEKGRQRVSGPELLMLAALLVVAGVALSTLAGREESAWMPSGREGDDRPGIAVLPCANMSTDPEDEYLASALHDEILLQLQKISALFSIGRTSVLQYAENPPPTHEIAWALRVGLIGECSVQKSGDQLRLIFQLLDGTSGGQTWAEAFERRLTTTNVFEIYTEIARQIATALQVQILPEEEARIRAIPTANAEAFRLYLQGQEYYRRPGFLRQNWEIAQGLFEQALELDATFALAHAALSEIMGQMRWFGYDPSSERLARQREEAETALRLDPGLPQAHTAMGLGHYIRRDWRAALDEFGIALQGLPSDAFLWGVIGYTHRRLGNWDELDAAYETATQLDPRDADLFWDLGAWTYHLRGRYADAIEAYDQALTLAPDLQIAALLRALVYFDWRGELDTLRAVLDQLPPDAADLAHFGTARGQKAQLLLWERKPDSLLTLLGNAPAPVFKGTELFLPTSLYAAWAHQMRGDEGAAHAAFDSALVQVDSALAALPDDRWIHATRGLTLAGLGRQQGALLEVRWLRQLFDGHEDHYDGPRVAAERARILAQVGDVDAALDEIEQLLARPSYLSVHRLRLDPRWDPLRSHPRFQALLEQYRDDVEH